MTTDSRSSLGVALAKCYLNSIEIVDGWRMEIAMPLSLIRRRGLVREFYNGFALLTGNPIPEGRMDKEYAINNIVYLLHAYFFEEDWSYRLYVCFEGREQSQAA